MKKYENRCEWVNIESEYGHDSFLLEVDQQSEAIKSFLSEIDGNIGKE